MSYICVTNSYQIDNQSKEQMNFENQSETSNGKSKKLFLLLIIFIYLFKLKKRRVYSNRWTYTASNM